MRHVRYPRYVQFMLTLADLGIVAAVVTGLWAMSMSSLTIYLHRYLSHRSFELRAPGRATLRLFFMLSFLAQRREWVGVHRLHHRFADTTRDPHPAALLGPLRSFVLAPLLYHRAAKDPSRWEAVVGDLPRDRVDALHERVPFIGPVLTLLVGCLTLGPQIMLIAYAIHLVILEVALSSLTALTHTIGKSTDPSIPGRDSHILALVLWGEGYHNRHHAYPRSPFTAIGIAGFDLSYLVIVLMSKVGMAQLDGKARDNLRTALAGTPRGVRSTTR